MATDTSQNQGMDPAGVNLPLIGQDEIQRRRALAQAMMGRGIDYSPVQSWTQGAARLADAAVGAYGNYSAGKLEQKMNQADLRALAPYLGGGGATASAIPAPSPMPPTAPPTPPPAPQPTPSPGIPVPPPQPSIQDSPSAGTPGVSPTVPGEAPVKLASNEPQNINPAVASEPRPMSTYDKTLPLYQGEKVYQGPEEMRDKREGRATYTPDTGRKVVAQAMSGAPSPTQAPTQAPQQDNRKRLIEAAVRMGYGPQILGSVLSKELEPQRPIIGHAGDVGFDPITHQQLFSVPEKPETGMTRTPEGREAPIPGGSKDPETIAATSAARSKGAVEGMEGTQEVKSIVDAMENGDQPPITTGLYRVGPAVRAEAEKRGINLSHRQLEWASGMAQMKTLNTAKIYQFTTAASSVVNTIDEVKKLSEQMQNTGVPLYNSARMIKYVETEGNSEKGQLAASYIAAVNTLKEEFAQLAQGGGVPTEPAWQLANQQIRGDYGVKELGASLQEVRRLIGYRINAIPLLGQFGPGAANQYTGATGEQNATSQAPVQQAPGKKLRYNPDTGELEPIQ